MGEYIKNIELAKATSLKDLVPFEDGEVVSLTLAQREGVNMTVMALDAGEQLSTHSASGDAMAFILEGVAKITIDGVDNIVKAGETIVMPSGVPHSVHPIEKFKMLLTVIKE